MAQKTKVKYRVIKQSAEVGGKYYGVIDNSSPSVPTLTMQEVIDYKKLHNFSPSQLAALIEDVLQGCAELVARDGKPRNLSELLKFEARIRGSFDNAESAITDQKIFVAPRMLKNIKVNLDKADFEFNNQNDTTAPRFTAAAMEYEGFTHFGVSSFAVPTAAGKTSDKVPLGALTLSGTRLCPNGWTSDCNIAIDVYRGGVRLCKIDRMTRLTPDSTSMGCWAFTPSVASLNTLTFPVFTPSEGATNAVRFVGPDQTEMEPYSWTPTAGDVIEIAFDRMLTDGSGQMVTALKSVTLGE